MKCRMTVVFLCVLALLVGGFYPLLAQQGSPQAPSGSQPVIPSSGFVAPQGGQTRSPYVGQMPYTPLPQGAGVAQPQQPLQPTSGPAVTSPQGQGGPRVPEPGSSIEAGFRDLMGVRKPGATGDTPEGLQQFGYSLFLSPVSTFPSPPSTIPGGVPPSIPSGLQPTTPGGVPGLTGALPTVSSPVSTFAPVEDVPVGPDYVLGPGDDLVINIWGAMENALVRTVNRNGQIILPTVGPVKVWGLTFSLAERIIKEHLSQYYRGFQTSVTMGRLRTIRVYVVGEVGQPGSYTISSLSTVVNALFASGGPIRLGSLRKIELKRNHHSVGTTDLYDFLLRGDKTRDFRLDSGDTIFVPTIGPVVGIAGEVKRPAIYELNGPTRLSDLIEMAGGQTPRSYLKRVQVIRAKPNAEREVIDLDLTALQTNGDSPANIELRDGDLARIYPTDPRIYNTISIRGVIKYPGEYEFRPNMRLTQFLPKGSVLPEAYLDGVEVIRLREDLTTEVISANLKKAWEGDQAHDLVLRPRDQVTVRTEIQAPKAVTLQGEVKLAGTYTIMPGERLSSVLRRAGGFTDKAFFKGALFTRRSVQETEKKRLEEFVRQHEERLLAERTSILSNIKAVAPTGQASVDLEYAQKQEQLRMVASRVTLGRIVIHLEEPEKLAGTSNDIILEDGDNLTVPQKPAAVLVMGSVRNPTAIVHKEGEDVEYYINRAGGFSDAADTGGMYLLKADGSALTGFLRLRNVEPGDAIIVPPRTRERYDWTWTWIVEIAKVAAQTALTFAALATIF